MVAVEFAGLPQRIRDTLLGLGYNAPRFRTGVKTGYKPNATIPLIWLVFVDDALLLCNTHRTRGLWLRLDRHMFGDVRTARDTIGGACVEIQREMGWLALPVAAEDLAVVTAQLGR